MPTRASRQTNRVAGVYFPWRLVRPSQDGERVERLINTLLFFTFVARKSWFSSPGSTFSKPEARQICTARCVSRARVACARCRDEHRCYRRYGCRLSAATYPAHAHQVRAPSLPAPCIPRTTPSIVDDREMYRLMWACSCMINNTILPDNSLLVMFI